MRAKARGVTVAVLLAAGAGCGRFGFAELPADAEHPADAAHLPDAQAIDAPTCPASFAVCDGFEDPALAPVWMADTTIVRDPTVAHRGTASMHSHLPALAPGVGGGAQLIDTTTLAITGRTVWIRAWLLLSALPIGANALELINADQRPPAGNGDAVFAKSDGTTVYTQFTAGVAEVPQTLATNTWICLVWQVVLSPTNGSLDLTGDIPPIHLSAVTDGNPAVDRLSIGLRFSGTNVFITQPPLDLWIDDVIINGSPVTCAD